MYATAKVVHLINKCIQICENYSNYTDYRQTDKQISKQINPITYNAVVVLFFYFQTWMNDRN